MTWAYLKTVLWCAVSAMGFSAIIGTIGILTGDNVWNFNFIGAFIISAFIGFLVGLLIGIPTGVLSLVTYRLSKSDMIAARITFAVSAAVGLALCITGVATHEDFLLDVPKALMIAGTGAFSWFLSAWCLRPLVNKPNAVIPGETEQA